LGAAARVGWTAGAADIPGRDAVLGLDVLRQGPVRALVPNFEAPVVRDGGGFHTDDYGLDLIVEPDGRLVWKDVEDLDAMRESGRMTTDEVLAVLAAAREVTAEIGRDQRWWAAWDGWTPPAAR